MDNSDLDLLDDVQPEWTSHKIDKTNPTQSRQEPLVKSPKKLDDIR